ncbi:MAG: hypothetical protein ABI143_09250 [Caldimonas sp.]
MSDAKTESSDRARLLAKAVSRWDNEGGAGEGGRVHEAASPLETEAPLLTNAELVQLQVRVIALENLVTVLLSQAPEHQLELARDMAAYISPRPGFTPHRLTIHAAARMINLVDSVAHLRGLQLGARGVDKPQGLDP